MVFVGPNNAGKSLALKELEKHLSNPIQTIVVKAASTRKSGTREDFVKYIQSHTKVTPQGSSWMYSFSGNSWSPAQELDQLWPDQIEFFHPLFCKWIPTETRISDSDPVAAINLLDELPQHPIHLLFRDDELEARISGYFRKGFSEDLVVDISAGSHLPLFIGERPELDPAEQRHSLVYSSRFRSQMVPLIDQGDGMRSFASVILHLLAPVTPSLLLLDEPEAFLHPPQARLLGEIIATEKAPGAQLFLATHSPDVLQGLINVAPEHLRVLRMQRDGSVNRIKELEKEVVKKIGLDPVMRYSSVLSGLFHERVIICEADADCMFYSSILDLPDVRGETHPDVLFVHANGKHRMATLAETLVALDVPVDIVADIDVLNDLRVLEKIVEALNGDWASVKPLARTVKRAIEEHKPWLSAMEVKKGIEETLEGTPSSGEFPKQLRSEINKLFRKASPWDAVKEGGESALPSGEATKKFQELQEHCNQIGLWIVPAGELEGFCKSVGGHGPRWVQQVIEDRDLATDSDLESARKFVKQLWDSKHFHAVGEAALGTQMAADA